MSYILEALRRAERERAQGQAVPGGDAPVAPVEGPPGRALLFKILIGALALNAILIIAWMLAPGIDPMPVQDPAPQLAAPKLAPIPSPATMSPAPIEAAPIAREEPVVEHGLASMDDLGASGEPEEVAPPPKTLAPAPEKPEKPGKPGGRVTFAKKPLTPEMPPPPAPPAQIGAPEAAPAAPPPASAGYKPLHDMSAAYQGAFPQFTMEVHVYDAQPARRFALIGGTRYHEGDALPQGARLVAIVPQGLVIEFRNEQVLFPIGRH